MVKRSRIRNKRCICGGSRYVKTSARNHGDLKTARPPWIRTEVTAHCLHGAPNYVPAINIFAWWLFMLSIRVSVRKAIVLQSANLLVPCITGWVAVAVCWIYVDTLMSVAVCLPRAQRLANADFRRLEVVFQDVREVAIVHPIQNILPQCHRGSAWRPPGQWRLRRRYKARFWDGISDFWSGQYREEEAVLHVGLAVEVSYAWGGNYCKELTCWSVSLVDGINSR